MAFCEPTHVETKLDRDSYCENPIRSIEAIHEILGTNNGILWILQEVNEYLLSIEKRVRTRDQVWDVFYTKRGERRYSGYSTKKLNELLYEEKKGIFKLKEILTDACTTENSEEEAP